MKYKLNKKYQTNLKINMKDTEKFYRKIYPNVKELSEMDNEIIHILDKFKQNQNNTIDENVKKKKTYTIIIVDYKDGSQTMKRINDGFNSMELLGLSSFIGQEIKDQIKGLIKPIVIKREVVV